MTSRQLRERPGVESPRYCCPVDGGELVICASELRCPQDHRYAVVNDIPRFVQGSNYADSFGNQFRRYPRTQLDSVTNIPLSRDRLRRCLGPAWELLRSAVVLEAGCGAGRFTEILLAEGATVSSVDLSLAVDANAANFPISDRHKVARADICRLPFAPQQFDVVLALGVVQHTPDPEATITSLYEQVRPGGWLAIDHYTLDLAALTRFGQAFRQLFKRMPADDSLRYTEWTVDRLLPLHKRLQRYGRLVSRLSPVLSYYHVHPDLPDDLQREWAMLDTYDTLADHYKHYRSGSRIRKTLEALGLAEIYVTRAGNGVEARGRRPFT